MSSKEVNIFILKVGATLGLAFAVTIFIAHLRGVCHMPGDNVSWLNIIIFMFVVMSTGRQCRTDIYCDDFTYGKAYSYVTKLNVVSAVMLFVFGILYYGEIAPDDLDEIIRQVEIMFADNTVWSSEQKELLMTSFKQALSPASISFVMLTYQFVGYQLLGLLLANVIKTKRIIKMQ